MTPRCNLEKAGHDENINLTITSYASQELEVLLSEHKSFTRPHHRPTPYEENERHNEQQQYANASPAAAAAAEVRLKAWKLCFGATGIYVAWLLHGNLEEDLFRYRSPLTQQKFQYVWLLQSVECLAAIAVGATGRWWCGSPHAARHLVRPLALPAVTQFLSKACTNFSLAVGLSFPVVILAKSAKIVPVMLGQLALGGVRYSGHDYLFVALIVSGTVLLSLGEKGDQEVGHQDQQQNSISSSTPVGLILISLSLVMDGGTAGLQKRLKKQMSSQQPTAYDFLVFTNLSMLVYALTIAAMTDDLYYGHAFLATNPDCWTVLLRCCLCSAIGQSFIFYVIAVFDPLVLSTVTTTRKILTVLLSVVLKGHSLTLLGQWGVALALTGMVVELRAKVAPLSTRQQPCSHHHENGDS